MKGTRGGAVSATCRPVGREGLREELGKTREMILNQLQHPDSGIRPDTLMLLLAQHLAPLADRWAEAERALAKEVGRGPDSSAVDVLVDEVLLQTGRWPLCSPQWTCWPWLRAAPRRWRPRPPRSSCCGPASPPS